MTSNSVEQPFGQTSQARPSQSLSCICPRQIGHSLPSFIPIGFCSGTSNINTMLPR